MWSPNEVIAVADSLATSLAPALSSTYAAAVTRTIVCAKWLIGSGLTLVALSLAAFIAAYIRRRTTDCWLVFGVFGVSFAVIGSLLTINGIVDLQSTDYIAAKKLLGLVFKGSSD
jgi:hypothetical protein